MEDPDAISNDGQPQWRSVSGQTLDLSLKPGFLGKCVSIQSFERLNQLGEGTYGVVYRARDRTSDKIVALKQIRLTPEERQNGIPITALREISILRSLKHQNVINVLDVAVGEESLDEIYMVMEYAEQDLANLIDELRVRFKLSEVKCLFKQLLEGLEYLHRNDIIHRDIKMQNLLLTAKGALKIADFGMARQYTPRPLTPGVVTIWYRPPEILLGTKHYTPATDLWSAGLILAELLLSTPCLPGDSPLDQLSLIVKLLGSPTQDDMVALSALGCPDLINWRRESLATGRADNLERRFLGVSSAGTVACLRGLLTWDPRRRWTASEALGRGGRSGSSSSRSSAEAEKWWKESPRAIERELLPTYPEVRNGVALGMGTDAMMERDHPDSNRSDAKANVVRDGKHDYVFDFDSQGTSVATAPPLHRPGKRQRRGP